MALYKIQLTTDQIEFLSQAPEQGMGYHIVDLTLKNGDVLMNMVVINGSFLQLDEDVQLTINDIDKIELHRD